jgi:hypothetical protein
MTNPLSSNEILTSLYAVERYSREHDYAGFCKFDALNSPWADRALNGSAWGRLLVTQAVNRTPLPLRRWLHIPPARNPKGVANFIKSYVHLHKITGDAVWVARARVLGDWLLTHDSASLHAYSGVGLGWGYHFPWQSPGFYAPRHSPNCIVTSFCADALLSLYAVTQDPRLLDAAREAAVFLLKALPVLEEFSDRKCIGYVPVGPKWKVVNINAVAAGFLSKYATTVNDKHVMEEARRLVAWTVYAQNPEGSWNYSVPRSQAKLGPDNYHTGGILDGLWDYLSASRDRAFLDPYTRGLTFYECHFFTQDGAPRWRANRTYPMDIHGAAQGILSFTKAAALDRRHLQRAKGIAGWAIRQMQDAKEGYFYYQKFRFFVWKENLMRWNNSWMAWALAELAAQEKG